jgi:hypothetical protein
MVRSVRYAGRHLIPHKIKTIADERDKLYSERILVYGIIKVKRPMEGKIAAVSCVGFARLYDEYE